MAISKIKKIVKPVTGTEHDFEEYLRIQRKNTTYNGIVIDRTKLREIILGYSC